MLPVSHPYVSLYATSDNETHFRMVQVRLDLVEGFAIFSAPEAVIAPRNRCRSRSKPHGAVGRRAASHRPCDLCELAPRHHGAGPRRPRHPSGGAPRQAASLLSTSRSDRGPSDPAAEVCVFRPGVDDIDHADQTSKPSAHLRGHGARRAGIPARWEPSGGICRSRG